MKKEMELQSTIQEPWSTHSFSTQSTLIQPIQHIEHTHSTHSFKVLIKPFYKRPSEQGPSEASTLWSKDPLSLTPFAAIELNIFKYFIEKDEGLGIGDLEFW